MLKKMYRVLFDSIVSKTPECFCPVRSFFVKKFIKMAGTNINIGRKSKIHRNTVIGNNSGVGFGCQINNGVTIGNDVMMGPNVVMYTQNHVTTDVGVPMRCQGMTEIRPITIEDDVWIGANVCILPGVTIGRGSVLGACSVIAKSVPPFSVVVGNPGKVVKSRLPIQNTNTSKFEGETKDGKVEY